MDGKGQSVRGCCESTVCERFSVDSVVCEVFTGRVNLQLSGSGKKCGWFVWGSGWSDSAYGEDFAGVDDSMYV